MLLGDTVLRSTGEKSITGQLKEVYEKTFSSVVAAEHVPAEKISKLSDGHRPNTLDIITNGKVDLIINTPLGKEGVNDDSYLRKAAIKGKIPYITTMAAAIATADGIAHLRKHGNSEVKSLQELHSEIHDK